MLLKHASLGVEASESVRTIRAGAPTAMLWSGTSESTTELAPTTAPRPMRHAGADEDVLTKPCAVADLDRMHVTKSLLEDRGGRIGECRDRGRRCRRCEPSSTFLPIRIEADGREHAEAGDARAVADLDLRLDAATAIVVSEDLDP